MQNIRECGMLISRVIHSKRLKHRNKKLLISTCSNHIFKKTYEGGEMQARHRAEIRGAHAWNLGWKLVYVRRLFEVGAFYSDTLYLTFHSRVSEICPELEGGIPRALPPGRNMAWQDWRHRHAPGKNKWGRARPPSTRDAWTRSARCSSEEWVGTPRGLIQQQPVMFHS